MMTDRILSVSFLLLLALAPAGCVSSTADQESVSAAALEALKKEAIPVAVVEARLETLSESLELTGTVQPWDDFTVSSEISGKISAILQEEGNRIEAGTLLVEIDRTKRELELASRKAEVSRAETEWEFAQSRLDRGEVLLEQGAISKSEVDNLSERVRLAEAEIRLARLAVERMEEELRDTRIFAPAAGQISERHVSLGEIVAPGSPLMTIIQTQPIKVLTEITEPYLPLLKPGTAVRVQFQSLDERETRGTIHRVHPVSNPASGSFPVEIRLDNRDHRLQPGMLARLQLKGRTYPDSLVVPLEGIVSMEGGDYLFIVENGKAQRTAVTVVKRIGESAIIAGEVRPGWKVVTRGNANLTDGAAVRVISE